MITILPNETRIEYLIRVAVHALREHAFEADISYDGTLCDGTCLAEELENEAESFFSGHGPDAAKLAHLRTLDGPSAASLEHFRSPGKPEEAPLPWPRPWRNKPEDGTFGDIVAADGEPVAQVQPLHPKFESDIVKRNNFRNIVARMICEAVNAADAGEIAAAVRASMKQEAQCPRCHNVLDVREGGIQGSVIVECKRCEAGAISKTGGLQDAIRNLSRFLNSR